MRSVSFSLCLYMWALFLCWHVAQDAALCRQSGIFLRLANSWFYLCCFHILSTSNWDTKHCGEFASGFLRWFFFFFFKRWICGNNCMPAWSKSAGQVSRAQHSEICGQNVRFEDLVMSLMYHNCCHKISTLIPPKIGTSGKQNAVISYGPCSQTTVLQSVPEPLW